MHSVFGVSGAAGEHQELESLLVASEGIGLLPPHRVVWSGILPGGEPLLKPGRDGGACREGPPIVVVAVGQNQDQGKMARRDLGGQFQQPGSGCLCCGSSR